MGETATKDRNMGETATKTLVMLPISDIYEHPDNPRKDLGDLSELTESVRGFGVLQNLTVVRGHMDPLKTDPEQEDGYTVIAGHRRLAAAKAAGLTEVPCVITEMTRAEQIRTMAMENMLRADLTPIEQADCFQLMLDLGDTKQSIAENTGFSRATIDRRLALRKLNRKKLEASMERGGTLSDYLKLEELDSVTERNRVLEKIGTNDFAQELSMALREQHRKKNTAAYEKELKDWTKPFPEKANQWDGSWERVRDYDRDEEEPEKLKKPKDAGKVQYYWKANYGSLTLYRKKEKTAEEKKKNEKSPEEKEYTRWMRETEAWLGDMDKQMYENRKAFVQEISEGSIAKNYLVYELAAEAGKLMANIYDFADLYWTKEKVRELFGIQVADKYRMTDEEKETEAGIVKDNPGRALLYGIFGMYEGRDNTIFWMRDTSEAYVYCKYKLGNEKKLASEYAFLERLGYELSTDEQEMLSGKMFEDLNASAPPVPES